MARIVWDQTGERFYETGVDHGVLYLPNSQGLYTHGVAWNGLTAVTESPSGAEANAQYADNIKYVNLISAEEFGGTIEAFTYPDEFERCDGSAQPRPGVSVGQQPRRMFGLSYRTLIGNDTEGQDHGYKIHLVYGAQAAPSEKAYSTVNDSPEAMTLSWEVTTTPVAVTNLKPTATITVDSRDFRDNKSALQEFENVLYGSSTSSPRLPLPDEVVELLGGAVEAVVPAQPTYDQETHTITIPVTQGVDYQINGSTVTGEVTISADTTVMAVAKSGSVIDNNSDRVWFFDYVA